jgi:hypothetical protein
MSDTQPVPQENNPDLLSSWLISQDVLAIIKKNYKVTQIIFATAIGYALLVFISTYFIFQFRPPGTAKPPYFFYVYRIYPLIELTMCYLNIWAYFTITKAYKQFLSGFTNGDPAALTTGFSLFYKTNMVCLVAFLVNTAHGIFLIARMARWLE